LSSAPSGSSSVGQNSDEETTLDIALKIIPKKKVKGNEASVWAEMEVLKGLDHPNIVGADFQAFRQVIEVLYRLNSTNGSNLGRNITCLSNLRKEESSLIGYAHEDGSPRKTL
jgi:hypothetical protein